MDSEQVKKKLQVLYTYIGQLEAHITDAESTLSAMKDEKFKKLTEVRLLEELLNTTDEPHLNTDNAQ